MKRTDVVTHAATLLEKFSRLQFSSSLKHPDNRREAKRRIFFCDSLCSLSPRAAAPLLLWFSRSIAILKAAVFLSSANFYSWKYSLFYVAVELWSCLLQLHSLSGCHLYFAAKPWGASARASLRVALDMPDLTHFRLEGLNGVEFFLPFFSDTDLILSKMCIGKGGGRPLLPWWVRKKCTVFVYPLGFDSNYQ